MNRKEIIELAREAGVYYRAPDECLERFAALTEQRLAGAVEPVGWRLVTVEQLRDWKDRINTLAALSLKNERYAAGTKLKQEIADVLATALQPQPSPMQELSEAFDKAVEQFGAERLALALLSLDQPEQEPVAVWVRPNGINNSGVAHFGETCPPGWVGAAAPYYAAPQPQPKQEPVAWLENLTDPQPHAVTDLKYCSVRQHELGTHLKYTPVYTTPQAQEPVAWRSYGKMRNGLEGWRFATCSSTYHDDPEQQPLYTAPQQREWVDLTREEVNELFEDGLGFEPSWAIYQEIAAKLRERNGGRA